MQENYRSLAVKALQIIVIAVAFAAVSWLAHEHQEALAAAVEAGGVLGPVAFVLCMAAFVVFVIPLDLVLLVPLGAALWGGLMTALLSIAGWTLGAAIAFGLARRYGKPLIARIVGEEKVARLEQRVPIANHFWSVVLLRMCIPVDLLSYALGLFGTLSRGRYILATAIGVTPFSFYFAYAGTLPLARQLVAVFAGFALAGVILFLMRRSALRT